MILEPKVDIKNILEIMKNYIFFKKGVLSEDNANNGSICNSSCPTNKGDL